MEDHGAGFPSENTHTWEPVWGVSAKKTRGPLPLSRPLNEEHTFSPGLTYTVGSRDL